MHQNTPEEEAKLANQNSGDLYHYKSITDKIRLYRGFQVNDVIVCQNKKEKYKITYIDPDYKTIWGRKICATGRLSKHLLHITGAFTVFKIDSQQIDAVLLGHDYNPAEEQKRIASAKREAYYVRRKERAVITGSISEWVLNNLLPGQTIWMPTKDDDRNALDWEVTVVRRANGGIYVKELDGSRSFIGISEFKHYNIYFNKPTVYRDSSEV